MTLEPGTLFQVNSIPSAEWIYDYFTIDCIEDTSVMWYSLPRTGRFKVNDTFIYIGPISGTKFQTIQIIFNNKVYVMLRDILDYSKQL